MLHTVQENCFLTPEIFLSIVLASLLINNILSPLWKSSGWFEGVSFVSLHNLILPNKLAAGIYFLNMSLFVCFCKSCHLGSISWNQMAGSTDRLFNPGLQIAWSCNLLYYIWWDHPETSFPYCTKPWFLFNYSFLNGRLSEEFENAVAEFTPRWAHFNSPPFANKSSLAGFEHHRLKT